MFGGFAFFLFFFQRICVRRQLVCLARHRGEMEGDGRRGAGRWWGNPRGVTGMGMGVVAKREVESGHAFFGPLSSFLVSTE